MNSTFFIASKVGWFFIDPANVLFVLIVAGAILSWGRFRRAGLWLSTTAAVFAIALYLIPLGSNAVQYLENRFPVNPTLPEKVDGIIVLGGSLNARITKARKQTTLDSSAERIIVFSDLALRWPKAKLVYSGGSGMLTDQSLKEADYVAPILTQLGLDPMSVIYENQSRNTYENAVYSLKLANPGKDETWILVTSASHMPRATGTFRAAGWPNIIPYPVDFSYKGDGLIGPPLNILSGMITMRVALHEWIGLTAYYVTGKTNTWLPAP